MRSLSRSRAAAFVALAAMMMLFIAPLVSKSLARMAACHQSVQHSPAQTVDAGAAHGEHAGVKLGMLMPHGGQSLMEDIACGYCQLLIHLPLILVIAQPLIWLMLFIFRRPPVGDLLCSYPSKSYRKNLARAPPAFALSV